MRVGALKLRARGCISDRSGRAFRQSCDFSKMSSPTSDFLHLTQCPIVVSLLKHLTRLARASTSPF
jgi:hypothetical protein